MCCVSIVKIGVIVVADLIRTVASCIALVGGIVFFVALFTPKRFVAKRPARFFTAFALLALSYGLHYVASLTP